MAKEEVKKEEPEKGWRVGLAITEDRKVIEVAMNSETDEREESVMAMLCRVLNKLNSTL